MDQERPAEPVDRDEDPFIELALRALDGQTGPEETASLQAQLAADAEKRRLFVQLCLHARGLSDMLGSQRHDDLLAGSHLGELDPRLAEIERELGVAWAHTDPDCVDGAGLLARRSWLPWAITAAACILSVLVTGLALWRRSADGPGPNKPVASAQHARQQPERTGGSHPSGVEFDDVAMVIELAAARWDASAGTPPTAGQMLGARRLFLTSGRATLAFASGVTLTLEGPADVDLVSIDRVFCRQGRLRARVPEGAKGFVVASPGSAVVDLGTEFGLNVGADGRARVFVFEGAAEAALLDAEGSPKLTQIVERSKAFELDPRSGRIDEAEARPDGFVPAPKLAAQPLVLDLSYSSVVLDTRPRSYWRFESLVDGAVPNEVAGGPVLRLNGPVAVTGSAAGNGCAVFQADAPEQFLFTDGLWELARTPGHAIELWFMADGIRYASLVGLFPPKDYLAPGKHGRFIHTFLLELTAHDRGSLFKPASARFLHRWPLDTRIGNNVVSEGLYVPGRWHHAIAQKNGGTLELYFDGALDRAMPLEPDHPTLSCRLVVGRRTPNALESQDRRPFVGRIDELAIYDRPLTASEVKSHYDLGHKKVEGGE
jgi:hypothetical protein